MAVYYVTCMHEILESLNININANMNSHQSLFSIVHSTGWTQSKWVIIGMYITDMYIYILALLPPILLSDW